MTRAQLERMAAEAAASAVEIERMCKLLRSRLTKLEAASAGAREQEARFRAMANSLDTEEALHSRSQKATVNDMNADARLNMSRAASPDDPFVKAVRAAKMTQSGLARKLKIAPSLLSMYRRKDDPRPIPQDRAAAIEALTGWKATAKNWPGGIVAGD